MARHEINGEIIITSRDTPKRNGRWDWWAVAANYDLGSLHGEGTTEQAAIDDLIEQMKDE